MIFFPSFSKKMISKIIAKPQTTLTTLKVSKKTWKTKRPWKFQKDREEHVFEAHKT